jgi:Transposase DDE domain group 1
VNANIRRRLTECKRRIERRLDKSNIRGCERPMLTASSIRYELAARTRAISAGGIGLMHGLVKALRLDDTINARLHVFKLNNPYHESDHVLNIAYNVLAGGACLEHLELLRNNEVYLNALGARRIPDPTTAGDFCRRFNSWNILLLQEAINEARLRVWRQQPKEFFAEAIIDGDGTLVETNGECKEGMDISYDGKWGYHPLLISLANTGEPLYLLNRSGNRPSHENAAVYFDRAIAVCRQAGFRRITLRGDTDFSQTEHLDRWDEQGVGFVFGIDAMPNLNALADNLPENAWKPLSCPQPRARGKPRERPPNVKEQIVEERGYKNIRLKQEHVAELSYQPTKCRKAYRLVVVRKDLEESDGQGKLFDKHRYFFYITNSRTVSSEKVVFKANGRCNQENLIEQLKNGARALTAPVDNLLSNWAYMVMASLAWSLKAWAALLVPETGRWSKQRREEKQTLLRMDFATFRQAIINIPAQIVRTSRRIVYRLLSWNRWQPMFFRLCDQLALPLRC